MKRATFKTQNTKHKTLAFTLFELLIATAIVGLILACVIPYVMEAREASNRAMCAKNLYALLGAMNAYAKDNNGNYPRVKSDPNAAEKWTAFTGVEDANPFADNSTVKPNDVTASLWLLVRNGYVTDLSLFVCPSSGDWPDRLRDAKGDAVPAKRRGNFGSPHNLSYSMFCPFGPAVTKWDDTLPSGFALLADKNPGTTHGRDVTKPASSARPEDFWIANSLNHKGGGQNVLYTDTTVTFEQTPYVGSGYIRAEKNEKTGKRTPGQPGDNIYTALRATPILPPEQPPANGNGVVGPNVSPAWPADSYLVPTAEE